MKNFFKAHRKKIWIVSMDVLCLPAAILFRYLSALMLQGDSVCVWVRLGGQCITCGGTHFVNDLLSGRIGMAFWDNQFLFVLCVYFAVSWILLNLYWLFDLAFAKKMLGLMYNIPMLIIFCVAMFGFLFWRNIHLIPKLVQLLSSMGE